MIMAMIKLRYVKLYNKCKRGDSVKRKIIFFVSLIVLISVLIIYYVSSGNIVTTETSSTTTVNDQIEEELLKKIIRYTKECVENKAKTFCNELNWNCSIYAAELDEVSLNNFLFRITKKTPFKEWPPTSVIYIVGFRDQHGNRYTLGISAYTGLPFVFTNWTAVDLNGVTPDIGTCYAKYIANKTMFNNIKKKTLKILHAMGYKVIEDLVLQRDPFTNNTVIMPQAEECAIYFIPIINGIQSIPTEYLYLYEPSLNGIDVEVDIKYPQSIITSISIDREISAVLDNFTNLSLNKLILQQEALDILKEWIYGNLSSETYYKIASYHVVNVSLGYAVEYKRINYTFIFRLRLFWVIPVIVLDENGGEHKYIVLIDTESGEVRLA